MGKVEVFDNLECEKLNINQDHIGISQLRGYTLFVSHFPKNNDKSGYQEVMMCFYIVYERYCSIIKSISIAAGLWIFAIENKDIQLHKNANGASLTGLLPLSFLLRRKKGVYNWVNPLLCESRAI